MYSIFYKLYEDIKNCNIYYDNNIADDECLDNTIFVDDRVKESERDNPKRLFQGDAVDFHSDDYTYEEASRLIIKDLEEEMEITFVKGRTDVLPETFAIRICNSGSRHQPFNVLFMHLYHELIEYDPDFHQIHIEEILYEMKRTRKK